MGEENASKDITKLEKKLKSTNGKLKAIEKYVKELTHENDLRIKDIEHEQGQLQKAKLSNKGKHYDSDDSAAEVEASAGGAYNGGNDLRLQRAVGKLESRIKS